MFNKRKKKIKAVPDKGRSPKGMIQDHSTERHKIVPGTNSLNVQYSRMAIWFEKKL